MTLYLFFSIQNGILYEQLKKPLTFSDDLHGLSNWVLRFPLTIYSANLHEKHVFREDSVTISTHSGMLQEQKWQYFVTTNHEGVHLYCTAQVFYVIFVLTQEKGLIKKTLPHKNGQTDPFRGELEEFYLPKCLILMSDQPYFKMHVNLLRIYRQIRKPRPNISHPINPGIISKYLTLKAQGHKQQFSIQNGFEGLKNAKNTTILDYYVSKINSHCLGESILLEKQTNFPILHLYKLTNNQLFQFSHFFNLPLSSHTVSILLTAILLEKQIIIASKSLNLTVMIIESLLEMVRPLKWQHMIVHNLPPHLLDAANQNFMPFLVGVNKKCLDTMNKENKFILLVEEDQLIEPEKMPEIGPAMSHFASVMSRTDSPSISNQRNILQHSIQFVCSLLKPLLSNRERIQRHPFYSQFLQTLICQYFIERVDKRELSQFVDLLEINSDSERKLKIERELTELTYYFHNPKFIFNEQEWIQYYLDKNNPALKKEKKQQHHKIVTLKEIKQSIINEHCHPKTKKATPAITRIRSHSAMEPRTKSSKKIKVSVVKHDQCHPLLNQLLEHRLGVASK